MSERFEFAVHVSVTKDELFGVRGFPLPKNAKKTFIAYRNKPQKHLQFRDQLVEALQNEGMTPVHGGDVPAGNRWPQLIRSRITDSKIVVADLTGPSREVLVEAGFAATKPSIYVTDTAESRQKLPRWIDSTQMLTFEGTGFTRIVQEIAIAHTKGGAPPSLTRGKAAPDRVLLVRRADSEWTQDLESRLEERSRESGLRFRALDPRDIQSYEDLADCLNGWCYIFALDGGEVDLLQHFMIGDLVGRRKAGSGTQGRELIERRGVCVLKPDLKPELALADSAARLPESLLAKARDTDHAFRIVAEFFDKRRDAWLG